MQVGESPQRPASARPAPSRSRGTPPCCGRMGLRPTAWSRPWCAGATTRRSAGKAASIPARRRRRHGGPPGRSGTSADESIREPLGADPRRIQRVRPGDAKKLTAEGLNVCVRHRDRRGAMERVNREFDAIRACGRGFLPSTSMRSAPKASRAFFRNWPARWGPMGRVRGPPPLHRLRQPAADRPLLRSGPPIGLR